MRRHRGGRWSLRRRIAFGAGLGDQAVLDDLAAAGENLRRAAELLAELFAHWPEDTRELRAEIGACETRGDELVRSIVDRLHHDRVGPLDRADVFRLAGAIDDIVDGVEEAAEETAMYRILAPLEQAAELSGVLRDAARELCAALGGLRDPDALAPSLQAVRSREQEGDRIYRAALADLFEGGVDPMLVVRWKDVLEAIEEAIDSCRAAADVVGGIVVKHR